jgi:hypothetical protein
MRISTFWDVMACSLVGKYRSLTGYSESLALLYQIPWRRTPEDGSVSSSHRENLRLFVASPFFRARIQIVTYALVAVKRLSYLNCLQRQQ